MTSAMKEVKQGNMINNEAKGGNYFILGITEAFLRRQHLNRDLETRRRQP